LTFKGESGLPKYHSELFKTLIKEEMYFLRTKLCFKLHFINCIAIQDSKYFRTVIFTLKNGVQNSAKKCHSLFKYPLTQACLTQTTFRATKGTKTAEGAAKVLKNSSAGYI